MLKLSCSIRFLLVADVSADLFQFEAHGGNRIAASPEMFAREVALFARESGPAMALFPFRNPMTEATGYLGGIAMHICTWSGIRCPSTILHSFCRARAWKIGPH